MLFILIPRTWFQNPSHAFVFGFKMVLEPTKTDQSEQSYGQMKSTTQIINNKNPRKLISFFAPMSVFVNIDPLLTWFTLRPCNFANNGRILAKPTLIDRANTGLSIGAGLVKIRPMLTKLQGLKINHIKNNGNSS